MMMMPFMWRAYFVWVFMSTVVTDVHTHGCSLSMGSLIIQVHAYKTYIALSSGSSLLRRVSREEPEDKVKTHTECIKALHRVHRENLGMDWGRG